MNQDSTIVITKANRRMIALFAFLLIVVISLTSYFAFKDLITQDSRFFQKSTTPVTTLIVGELIKPLYIAQTLAADKQLVEFLEKSDTKDEQIIEKLESLKSYFDLDFFVAAELSRKQYFSDGRVLDIDSGEVRWYDRLKKRNQDVIVGLGDSDDAKVFYDIRVTSQDGTFLGFVGIGIGLNTILKRFNQYKAIYGYNMILVNEDNQIMLSSYPALNWSGAKIETLDDFEWFQGMSDKLDVNLSLDGEVIQINEQDHLVSFFTLTDLNWNLMLLLPMQQRQQALYYQAVKNVIILAIVCALVYFVLFKLLGNYGRSIKSHMQYDALTKLANREKVTEGYETLSNEQIPMSIVMLDIDHFKNVNDTHGHNAGDLVIKHVADILKDSVRSRDIIGRWGGEEFILLLPRASVSVAEDISNRIRKTIENTVVNGADFVVGITCSFGVAKVEREDSLEQAVERADQLLYKAKAEGRNKVCRQDL